MKERYNASFSSAVIKPEKGNEHAYVCFNQRILISFILIKKDILAIL